MAQDALDLIVNAYRTQQTRDTANDALYFLPNFTQGQPVGMPQQTGGGAGGRSSVSPTESSLQLPVPRVPDLFDRPQQQLDVQTPLAQPAPAPPAVPMPPAQGANPGMQQALLLQSLLQNVNQGLGQGQGGLYQALSGLVGAFGGQAPGPFMGSPLAAPSGGGTPWQGAVGTVLGGLDPTLQAIPELQSLFTTLGGAPAGWSSSPWGGQQWMTGFAPTVSPALQAIAQYIVGQGGQAGGAA